MFLFANRVDDFRRMHIVLSMHGTDRSNHILWTDGSRCLPSYRIEYSMSSLNFAILTNIAFLSIEVEVGMVVVTSHDGTVLGLFSFYLLFFWGSVNMGDLYHFF